MMLYRNTALIDFAFAGSDLTLSTIASKITSLCKFWADTFLVVGCMLTDFKSTYAPVIKKKIKDTDLFEITVIKNRNINEKNYK